MTKEEAKKFLYNFLRKHGIATRFYYNCIYNNQWRSEERIKKCERLSGIDKLKMIMSVVVDEYVENGFYSLDNFFNFPQHTFVWGHTEEGYNFWCYWSSVWIKELNKKGGRLIIEI